MNLFDELAADAERDIKSGKYLQSDNNNTTDIEISKQIDDMEKRMQDTLNKAIEKINNSADAAATNINTVPTDTVTENNPIVESEEGI